MLASVQLRVSKKVANDNKWGYYMAYRGNEYAYYVFQPFKQVPIFISVLAGMG